MNELQVIPLVLALTEMVKRFGVPAKYCPLVSMAIGVGLAFLFAGSISIEIGIKGIIFGLSASGLYSVAGKKVITGVEKLAGIK